MSNAIFTLILFSISFLEAQNFERIDLVLSNDYVFKRVKPNDQIILNGVHVEYQNININSKKIAFKSKAGKESIIFNYDEIKSLRIQVPNSKFLILGSIFGSGAYALWGYSQSSTTYEVMKEEGAQNRILPFTFGAGIFGGIVGFMITYPIQKLYNYKNPNWSEELIIHSDWSIL